MIKLAVSSILCFLLLSCNSDDDSNSQLAGQNYVITSYLLDTAIDLNGDGTSSNDLLIETPLFPTEQELEFFLSCVEGGSLYFVEEGISCPLFNGLGLEILENETTGELTQFTICVVVSCAEFTSYTIIDDRIVFSFGNDINLEGLFVDDTITITFSEEEIPIFEFLQSDGTTFIYNGGATITYTLK